MSVCCIGGVCIPYSALLPLVLIILKPILEFLGLYKYVEQFQNRGKKKTNPSSSTLESSEERKCDSSCDPIGALLTLIVSISACKINCKSSFSFPSLSYSVCQSRYRIHWNSMQGGIFKWWGSMGRSHTECWANTCTFYGILVQTVQKTGTRILPAVKRGTFNVLNNYRYRQMWVYLHRGKCHCCAMFSYISEWWSFEKLGR